jgi:hypothetical protein
MPITRDEFKKTFTAKYIVDNLKMLCDFADSDATKLAALIFAAKAAGHYIERSNTILELPESVSVVIELGPTASRPRRLASPDEPDSNLLLGSDSGSQGQGGGEDTEG